MTAYINTSWDHPHLYGASKYTHGIQMGADYALRVYHGPILRPAAVSVTRDGVYCGECGADITGAWQHAQRETDPQPDVVMCGEGQPPTVNDEPVDVDRLLGDARQLRTNHAELVEEHAALGEAYRTLLEGHRALLERQRTLMQERYELQEQIAGYDESNTLLSRTVSELQEQLQHATSEEQRDDTTTDLNRLALRAEGAEYALQSLQLGVAGMAQDFDHHTASPRPDYIAKRLRSMLPPTIRDAWGLAGWWATDRILGDVQVVDAAADDDGEVEVQYLEAGKPVQGYAHAGALTNWRTTR